MGYSSATLVYTQTANNNHFENNNHLHHNLNHISTSPAPVSPNSVSCRFNNNNNLNIGNSVSISSVLEQQGVANEHSQAHQNVMPRCVRASPRAAVSMAQPANIMTSGKPAIPGLARAADRIVRSEEDVPHIHSTSIVETMRNVLSDVDTDDCEPNGENAFLVCDIKRVWDRYILWQEELGDRVEAFFAVKCNPDPVILRMMARLGLGFDCASHAEISSVLSHGVSPDKIIYANPAKAASFIRHAAKAGVEMMTFDNADELVKVKKHHPNAKMVLRILTDDSGSLCKLGLKFGAPLSEVRSLLERAKALQVEVIGISFHVGSGCTNPALFADAVERANWAFSVAEELEFNFEMLDVGGGFGGDNFVEIARILRPALDRLFPAERGVRIIAEPGRYFVAEAFEMATNIIARRGKATATSAVLAGNTDTTLPASTVTVGSPMSAVSTLPAEEEEPMVMYYVNDGVYGAFNCIMFDHQVVHPKVLTLEGDFIVDPTVLEGESDCTEEPCSIWGPTCDSIDCVSKMSFLPTQRLAVGDWLRWENMGAYTICAASQFNGFHKSRVIYTIDADADTEAEIRGLLS